MPAEAVCSFTCKVRVIDISAIGIEVFSKKALDSQDIDISTFEEGMYTLVVTKNGQRASARFVKK